MKFQKIDWVSQVEPVIHLNLQPEQGAASAPMATTASGMDVEIQSAKLYGVSPANAHLLANAPEDTHVHSILDNYVQLNSTNPGYNTFYIREGSRAYFWTERPHENGHGLILALARAIHLPA